VRNILKPVAPLMIEHRLIERMVGLLKKELNSIESKKRADVNFIFSAVDFFRSYADRTHHGKEEDILFKELKKKKLSKEHKKILDELIKEHTIARSNVKGLFEAAKEYASGNSKSADKIKSFITALINLYPAHISKEDTRFFIPILDYFTADEQSNMLERFFEFDRLAIHEKYKRVVEQYE
jgi:hemerythrin-like domain-containing protein